MKTRLAYFSFIFALVLFVSVPFVARAQTAEDLRAQIASLLERIYALQQQIQQPTQIGTTGSISTAPVQTGTFQYSGCPDLQYNLERGMRDANVAAEVSMVQRFLAQDPTLYPEGEVTGYFGPATERAIQRFQVKHGIVVAGDYESTGYGRVGPRTRWAIKNSCGTATGTGATGTVQTYGFTVSPTFGSPALTTTAAFEYTGSTCTSYVLDWGDGSVPATSQVQALSNCSNDLVKKEMTHVYSTAGNYAVTLKVGKGTAENLPVVGRLSVAVEEDAKNYPVDPNAQASLTFSTTEGTAPFVAGVIVTSSVPLSCTSYEIDWGDGSALARKEAAYSPCIPADGYRREFTHTYKNAGSYTLRVRVGSGVIEKLPVATREIVVHSAQTGSTSSCFIEPNTGVAPLTVRARILLGGSLCDGNLTYSVDWGDSSATPVGTCTDKNTHYEEFTHTYLSSAVYTARLQQAHPNAYFDEEVCTVNVAKPAATTPNQPIANTCSSWTDGCNTCARSYVGGPATCTQRYCIQAGSPQCYASFPATDGTAAGDSLQFRILSATSRTVEFTANINTARSCNGGLYTIYFGDSNSSPQPFPADACASYKRTVTYQYAQDGTYTVVLTKDGATIDQATVVISGPTSAVNKNLASALTAIEAFVRSLFK